MSGSGNPGNPEGFSGESEPGEATGLAAAAAQARVGAGGVRKPGDAAAEEPSFTWRFTHALDRQFRVQCPAAWRPTDPNFEFMLVIWPHQPTGRKKAFVMGLTQKRYRRLQALLDDMPLGDPKAGALRRAIFEDAIALKLDPSGRFCLPKEMCTDVGLGKDVLFVGAGSQFQMWDPETYKACREAEAALAQDAFNMI